MRFEYTNNDGDTNNVNSLTTAEVGLYARFAYKEKFVSGEFSRVSLGTKYPTILAQYKLGISGVFESTFDYHKLILGVSKAS